MRWIVIILDIDNQKLTYAEFDEQRDAREELKKADGKTRFLILGAFIEGKNGQPI